MTKSAGWSNLSPGSRKKLPRGWRDATYTKLKPLLWPQMNQYAVYISCLYMFANFHFVLKVATLLKDFTIYEYLQHSQVTLALPCVWWSAILRISHVEDVMLLNCSGREWKLQPAALAPSTSDQLGWTAKCLRKLRKLTRQKRWPVSMVSSRCVGCRFQHNPSS